MYPAPPKLQPAFFGGLFIGVLSALPLLSACCCLWMVAGGTLAVYLMQQNHPYPITTADGALVGLLAGVIGGVIGTIIAIPVQMMMGPFQQQLLERMASNSEIPPEMRAMIENMGTRGIGAIAALFNLVFSVILGLIFGMLGGLLGVALFKKKDLPPPPGTVEVLPPV
jgi:hypothetical protein